MKHPDVIRTDVQPNYITRWYHWLAIKIGVALFIPARALLRFGHLPAMWRMASDQCAKHGLQADGIEVTVRVTVQHHLMNPRARGKCSDEVLN